MSPAPAHGPLIGIYCKLGSIVLFCTMDAMVKSLGGSYGALQLALFRSAIAFVPLTVVIWRAGGLKIVRSRRPGLQFVRIFAALGSMFGFFYVFPRMPLVDAYAISYASPFFIVALAVPLPGVMLMLNPWSIGLHAMSLVVLAATFCYSLSTVLVRLASRHDHDAVTMFWFSAASSVVSLVLGVPDWIWPSAIDWVWLILLGLLGGVAQILVTRAWRLAPAAVLAPFDYVSIVFAMLYGYLWFKEDPSWTVWLGLPLVIGSGLYILHRERVRAGGRQIAAA